MNKHEKFLQRWAANSERLHRIGLDAVGYDPGYLCDVQGQQASVNMTEHMVTNILVPLIKKAYPETMDDEKMIEAWKKRQDQIYDAIENK